MTRTTSHIERTTAGARSTPLAAALAWILPGLGHWYLGYRNRAVVFFVTIVVTFWTGVAVGGISSTVNVQENGAWFAAQICAGAQTLGALMWSKQTVPRLANEAAYPSADVAVVYTGVAGLLNLLIMIDALARNEPGKPQSVSPSARGGGSS